MNPLEVLPDAHLSKDGFISAEFLRLGIDSFLCACRYVHRLPYGYNRNRDDLRILFKEGMGTCTTKHAVIAALAQELKLPVAKNICIYGMTEEIVTGTSKILEQFDLPYVPMVHCFLVYNDYRVDLTEGNQNGKNRPIDEFLHTETVKPDVSAEEECLLYRQALADRILLRDELRGADIKRILHARENGIKLLKSKMRVADRIDVKIFSSPSESSVKRLLSDSGLPIADITDQHLKHFFFCGEGKEIEGLVGLELYGEVALLRSLAVEAPRRGLGLGTRLVEHAECYAQAKGVRSIFLLTRTAEAFFSRRGYTRTSRKEAPETIQTTREFSGICPASSTFMSKHF